MRLSTLLLIATSGLRPSLACEPPHTRQKQNERRDELASALKLARAC